MKTKILCGVIISTTLFALAPTVAKAWIPTLTASMNTNGGHDMSISPGTSVNHTYSWNGNYSSFSGYFYAKPGYSKSYTNVTYKSDSLITKYTTSDYSTTATINVYTDKEDASDYIHVYVLH